MIKNRVCVLASLVLLGLVSSCKTEEPKQPEQSKKSNQINKVSKESLKASIKSMEDSIKILSTRRATGATSSLSQQEFINRLTAYYRNYPKDPYSADCLFKLQMVYSGLNAHSKSISYGDTLLRKFPSYNNKFLVIESNIAALDVFIVPRDTARIRRYYTMLLTDNEYAESNKKEIRSRLAHLELSIFEYANLPAKQSAKK